MERYWITGAQIGIMLAYLKENKVIDAKDILDEIQENQFIGNNPENSIPIKEIFK
jgi:hypothetical protein